MYQSHDESFALIRSLIADGVTRDADCTSVSFLFAFLAMLVINALQSRARYYCLGLAVSVLLAGFLLPILDRHYSYFLPHCIMAAGYLTGMVIQWVQLRKAAELDAAN